MKSPRLVAAFLFVCSVACARAVELTVYAAASLSESLAEVARLYEQETGDAVRLNFGASSALAVQLRHGAKADVFFSADAARMEALASSGLIAEETRRSVLSNALVIVVHAEIGVAISGPADLTKASVRRLALAEPQTVPAGVYAKEYLTRLGLWDGLAGKVIPTESVRACLAAVESGNADAGIVYATDARVSRKVKVAYAVPAEEGPRISYPVAVLKESQHPAEARAFVAFLASPKSMEVFTRAGFLAPRTGETVDGG